MKATETPVFRTDEIESRRGKDWKRARFVLVVVVIFAALSGIFFAADLLRFTLITDAQSVISILFPLFLCSLFVERAVEVFLTLWRGKETDELTLAVRNEAESFNRNPDRARYNAMQRELTKYKGTTRDIAFVCCFILGVLISLSGVRALAMFVDPTSLDDLGTFQTAWFTVLDIFITGALIGGGSEGLHRIISMIVALLDSSKAKALSKS